MLGDFQTPASPGSDPAAQGVQGVANSGTDPQNVVQPARQVGSPRNLPFTGYAAIPILVLGIALLTAGVIARRRLSGVSVQ